MATTSTSASLSNAKMAGGPIRRYLRSGMHQGGMDFVKADLGFGKYGKGFGRVIGPAFLAYNMYTGYKEDGIRGALKEGVSTLATSYVMGALNKPMQRAAMVIASGFAAYGSWQYTRFGLTPGSVNQAGAGLFAKAVRPLVAEHMRRKAEVEMGAPIIDQYGTLATMRQRSLAAIQNSKINGRSALGNEAALHYSPYYR